MSSGYHQISENASEDVEVERVERIKLKLTSTTYTVVAEAVAAKMIEYMLNLGRDNHPRKKSRKGKETKAVRILTLLEVARLKTTVAMVD